MKTLLGSECTYVKKLEAVNHIKKIKFGYKVTTLGQHLIRKETFIICLVSFNSVVL